MFRQVFDPDDLFWRLISRGVDLVGLSLLWAALCLPAVTIGPATSALYYTVVKVFRQKEAQAFVLYWKTFRANLKKGCVTTLICLPVVLLFAFGYAVMDQVKIQSPQGTVMFVAYWVALLIPAGVARPVHAGAVPPAVQPVPRAGLSEICGRGRAGAA